MIKNENQEISLEEAAILTERFRNLKLSPYPYLGGYFFKENIINILNQNNCFGIRIYYAIDQNNEPTFVLTGIDSNENDLYTGKILEHAVRCPNRCSENNPLNS